MKEYKLLSWPDLPVEFRRTAFRRLLCELSQRHISESMLLKREGIKASETRALLKFLASREVLEVRQATNDTGRWRPAFTSWLRRLTA